MADNSDVEAALEAAITAALYTTGAFPSPAAVGVPVRIYRGWPTAGNLDADLRAGIADITIWPLPTARNTTRHLLQTSTVSYFPTTLTAVLSGGAVSLGGTIAANHVIGIACFGIGYAYRLLGTETLASLATILAAEIPGAVAVGSVLTLPTDVHCSAQVVADAMVGTEYGRVEHEFQITLWCQSSALRDIIGALVTPQLVQAAWLALPYGESGRLRYRTDVTSDKAENAGQFRRDIRVSVDYPVSVFQTLPCMLFGVGEIVVPGSGTVATFGVDFPLGAIVVNAQGSIVTDQAGTVLANPSV